MDMISVYCKDCEKELERIDSDFVLHAGEDQVTLSDGSIYLERRCESCSTKAEDLRKNRFRALKKLGDYGSKE